MLAILVIRDPIIDRSGRYAAVKIIGMLLLHASRNLLRRPALGQPSSYVFLDCRVIHPTGNRPLTATAFSLLLRLASEVLVARRVTFQFPRDRRGGAPQDLGDFVLAWSGKFVGRFWGR